MHCRFGTMYGRVVLVLAYLAVSGGGTDASRMTGTHKYLCKQFSAFYRRKIDVGRRFDDWLCYRNVAIRQFDVKPENCVFPSYLQPCHRKDPNLNTCVKNTINNIIRNIKNGSKEIDLPPIDPHHVDFVEVDEGSGNVSLKMSMSDILMTGLSLTEVVAVKANVDEYKFEIASKTPYVDIQGQFKAEGAVLNFPLVGSGNFWINMSDVTAVWILYYQSEPHNDETYLTIENLGLDVIPSDVRYSFGDMLDGDNKLGEAMNQFLNENSHEIFNELKPRAIKIFNQIFTGIANHFLSKFAAADLLPE